MACAFVPQNLARRKNRVPISQKNSITATGKYSKYALTDVLICGECGTHYKRVTWSKKGKKKIVWRCVNRLDYGTKYCKDSLTIEESVLHRAIVRALNKFNSEDRFTYLTLMKATIGEALGINGGSDEIDLLERKIEALNRKMIEMVNDSVQNGNDIESYEEEFRHISEETEALKRRIDIIRKSQTDDETVAERLTQIQVTIAEREANKNTYDDSIVRQMIECIKVYPDGKLEVIFGGGVLIEEQLNEITA